jgi:hypothetical protein
VTSGPWRWLLNSWALRKCKIYLWLAIRNRCWIADKLAKRGLSHPDKCPLCDQEDESIQHLLTMSVVAREFWFRLFAPIGQAGSVTR